MNVGELIAELEEHNPEAPVLDEYYDEAYIINTEPGGDTLSGLVENKTGYVIIQFGDPLTPPPVEKPQ